MTEDICKREKMNTEKIILLVMKFKSDFAFLADESFKCKHLKRYFSMECEEK